MPQRGFWRSKNVPSAFIGGEDTTPAHTNPFRVSSVTASREPTIITPQRRVRNPQDSGKFGHVEQGCRSACQRGEYTRKLSQPLDANSWLGSQAVKIQLSDC